MPLPPSPPATNDVPSGSPSGTRPGGERCDAAGAAVRNVRGGPTRLLAAPKRDDAKPGASVEFPALVRLLGRYLNSGTEAKKRRDLLERARSEHVERDPTPRPKAPTRLPAQQNAEIVSLYEAGWRPVDIARQVGTSEWTAHHRLNRNGVKKRYQPRDS